MAPMPTADSPRLARLILPLLRRGGSASVRSPSGTRTSASARRGSVHDHRSPQALAVAEEARPWSPSDYVWSGVYVNAMELDKVGQGARDVAGSFVREATRHGGRTPTNGNTVPAPAEGKRRPPPEAVHRRRENT
ncbi:hypothetical protein HU200_042697 [Digitaria exilis]|uniref:Uncharacterized protein n=1 Tax=Digitaria exilis TaxID=1010633 RepID=A0A835B226_9POAL|nr:hypothetical protein HU200_042697 [Digitaria exilis]